MPVTVSPSDRAAESWGKREQLTSKYSHATSPSALLLSITTNDGSLPGSASSSVSSSGGGAEGSARIKGVVQSTFSNLSRSSTVFSAKNGLVHGCIEAYNEHHNLVLRPEDVWFAILTQLSAYVNAHAEELRHLFVTHTGQQHLHIETTLEGLDHGRMAYEMTKLMTGTMSDETLKDWVLPSFSTTEKDDQAVASIIMMGTMQKYYTYSWGTRCGIPSVTLLGEADDWVEIRARCASRLATGGFGKEAAKWYRVLAPVLEGFIETFKDPKGAAARKFWQGVCDKHRPNGSGHVTYSGWITAFCYWDEKGKCLHDAPWGQDGNGGVRLSRSEIPMGFSKVPVTLLDNGNPIAAEMLAGSVGLRISKQGMDEDDTPDEPGRPRKRWDGYDTIHPQTGWFMYYVRGGSIGPFQRKASISK